MKASTALFASIVVVCCTVGIVNSQILFADGSVQTTAFDGEVTIPIGRHFDLVTDANAFPTGPVNMSSNVPAGQQLVILKVIVGIGSGTGSHYLLYSQLNAMSPKFLARVTALDGSGQTYEFPNGSVIIDEGRSLWVSCFDKVKVTDNFTTLGYYRDK